MKPSIETIRFRDTDALRLNGPRGASAVISLLGGQVLSWITPDDRERLFAMLEDFPHVLLLSGHTHTQRHWYHDASTGWHGMQPLHEYNVGAACGAYWSGIKDAEGIPDTTMADGTPNGYARLRVDAGGAYALSAARALVENTELDPEAIVRKSLAIAGDLCVYTNHNFTLETLD